jgi:hypothetical protein
MHNVTTLRARRRSHVIRYGRPAPDSPTLALEARPRATHPTPTWTGAVLTRRVCAIDVLACPNCGGRLRLIATLHDPAVIPEILAHLGRSHSGQSPGPAPPEPGAAAP